MAEIKSLSVRHNEIMDYLMANPTTRLGDVARHFGVTQPWLSQIIHSDIFQASLREKQDVAFHHTVLSVREKIEHVAHMALDRLAETLPLESDTRTLNTVAENVLDRLGFGTKQISPSTTQNTTINVLSVELQEARALLGKAERPQIGVVIDAADISKVSDSSQSNLGKDNKREISPFLAISSEGDSTETGVQT